MKAIAPTPVPARPTSPPAATATVTITVDESGLDTRKPSWLNTGNEKDENVCLKKIVLVGSSPEVLD